MSGQILDRRLGGRRNLWHFVDVDDHVRESSSIVNLQRMRKRKISTQVHMRNVARLQYNMRETTTIILAMHPTHSLFVCPLPVPSWRVARRPLLLQRAVWIAEHYLFGH